MKIPYSVSYVWAIPLTSFFVDRVHILGREQEISYSGSN